MKHLLVIALAPKGEDFDPSTFVTNEAAWMSTTHLDAIEAALGKGHQDLTTAQTSLTGATTAQKKAEGELVTANATIVDTAASLDTANGTITSLNAKIVAMGKVAAGGFTNTIKTEADKVPGEINTQAQYLTGYYGESLPVFQCKVYHPKGDVVADINLVVFSLT